MNQGGKNAAPDYTAGRTSLCGIFAAYFTLHNQETTIEA
jgi:hypothetical protein